MTNSALRRRLWTTSVLVAAGGLMLSVSPAGAQENPAEKPSSMLEEVVVTGSRIPRPEIEALQPTVVTSAQAIEQSGLVNLGNVVRESPLFQAYDQQSGDRASANTAGDAGATFANLYNLGSQRTLTLVNGKRVVGAQSANGAGSSGLQVDISAIPTGLVSRIETISVGGAPIYGSDAIAGTVNIILKDDFEGLEVEAQGGVTEKGDGENGRIQVLFGRNFDEGRGNITLSAAYARQEGISAQDRHFQLPFGFVGSLDDPQVNVPVTGGAFILGSANGRPSTFFGLGGVDVATGAPFGFYTNAAGQPLTFDATGALVPFTPGAPAGAVFSGAALVTTPPGSDTDSTRLMAPVVSPSERIYFNGFGHYAFTDNLRAFARFSYTRTDASFTAGAPLAYALGGFPDPNTAPMMVTTANPFMAPAVRSFFDANPGPFGPTVFLNRELRDITTGRTDIRQDTWTAQAGFEGDFEIGGRKVGWDLTFSDGRTNRDQRAIGVVSARFAFAQDAVYATPGANGAPGSGSVILPTPANLSLANFTYDATNHVYRENGTGNLITCRVRVTGGPAGASPNDVSTCAPYNPFGAQNPEDALNYLRGAQFQSSEIEQQYVQGNANATLFDLPAGPLQWAGGFEVRKESARYDLDAGLQSGSYYLGFPRGAPVKGDFTTKEVYSEIKAPLVDADMLRQAFGTAFFQKLEFEGAVRYMDDSVTGDDVTWTAGGRLEISKDLTIRGNRTRSVRQPAIAELYAGTIPSTTSITDPCAVGVIATGPAPDSRRANCRQAVIDSGLAANDAQADAFLATFTTPLGAVNGTFSGNPNLDSEVAKSWTVGAVLTPRFAPGLMITADWVDIRIKGAIAALGGGGVADACYDSANLDNEFCAAITRNPANFKIVGFTSFDVNQDTREFAGLTVQASYAGIDVSRVAGQAPGEWGSLSLNALVFYLDHDRSGVGGTGLVDQAGATGSERYRAQVGLNYELGKFAAAWQTTYYGPSKIDPNNGAIFRFNRVRSYYLNDLAVSYDLTPDLRLQAIVNNVFDAKPPFNSFSYQFDRLGRRFVLGVRARF